MEGAASSVQPVIRKNRATLDCAGKVVAGALAASAVLGAQRTNVNGTTRLQPAVPLVRGFEHGRLRFGRDRVHEEPRAPARWGTSPKLSSKLLAENLSSNVTVRLRHG